MSEDRTKLVEFVTRYGPKAGEDGPVRYVAEVLGVENVDPWQDKTLRAYGRGIRHMAIAACHGPGKTALAAWLVNYQLDCVFPQVAAATAPSKPQMEDALLKEVHLWFGRKPEALRQLYNEKQYRIELIAAPEESFFTAATARAENPEALQGKHVADGGRLLLIADEASGVHENVFKAAQGSMSGHNATTLMLSNPTRSSGLFYDAFHTLNDSWWTISVGADDSPRVSAEFAEQVARTYGRESNEYRIRVMGQFPKSDLDTVIPWEFVNSARERDIVVPDDDPEVWGLDVARFGDDRNALVKRTRRSIKRDIKVWSGTDLMETTGRVKREWDEIQPFQRPKEILVDVIGLGAGVVDRLRELGLPVRGVNVAESATISDRYMRARDELWFKCREWLQGNDVTIPARDPDKDPKEDPLEILCSELIMPKYKPTSGGKIQVEPKSETKKRLSKSPDVADALILTFAGDLAALTYGSTDSYSWNKPVKRNLSLV